MTAFRIGAASVSAALLLLAVPADVVSEVPGWCAVTAGFAILAFVAVIAFRFARQRGQNPWADATAVFSFYYAVFFGAGLLTLFFWDILLDQMFPQLTSRFQQYGPVLPDVSRLTVIGGLALVAGSLIPGGALVRVLPRVRWQFDGDTFFRRALFFLPVAAACLGVTRFSPELLPKELFHFVQVLGETSHLILVLCSYSFFRAGKRRWRWAWLYLVYAVVLVIRALPTGMRGDLLLPFAFPVLGYVMARAKLPWRYLLVGVGLFFFVIIPWATFLKESTPRLVGPEVAMSQATVKLRGAGYRRRLGVSLWSTVRRFAVVGGFANCRRKVPRRFPYQHGKVLLTTLMALPPRAIWPDKPNVSAKLNYYSQRLGIISKGDKTSSAVLVALGLYYLDFGPVGILVLCVFHGWCVRLLRDFTVGRCTYEWGAAVFLLLTLTKPDLPNFIVWMSGAIRMILVSLPVVYVLSHKRL